MDSTKLIKTLKFIFLKNQENDKGITEILQTIGQNVESLEISGYSTIITDLQLKNFLDNLPNCKNIKLDCQEFKSISENVLEIKNTKVQSFTAKIEFNNYYQEKDPNEISKFFNNIKFPDDCLNHFKFIAHYHYMYEKKSRFLSFVKNFVENQNFNKIKCWYHDQNYICEFKKEIGENEFYDSEDDKISEDDERSENSENEMSESLDDEDYDNMSEDSDDSQKFSYSKEIEKIFGYDKQK